MVTMNQIGELGRRIGEAFHPDRVILFGSYAGGVPTRDSDVDILVVLPHEGKHWRTANKIRKRLRPAFPLDLIVRAPAEFRERRALGDCFLKEIHQKGKVLYESSDR